MVASPDPDTSQSLDGLPGRVFSHATGLTTGGPHGPAACAAVGPNPTTSLAMSATTVPIEAMRGRRPRSSLSAIHTRVPPPYDRGAQTRHALRTINVLGLGWWHHGRLRGGGDS